MYAIKRIYGRHEDFLMAWDEKYGTACIGAHEMAMEFQSYHEAEKAAERANKTCYRKPEDMWFEVVKTA